MAQLLSTTTQLLTALPADSAQLRALLCPAGLGTTGLNLLTGTARNPHSTAHHTGGSSSGCAAIVAAGLCPFALGER